ncbi:hypothetical protein RJ640_003085 [Escallonia rubra]|uniref:Transcription factor Pur-alpha 1 n=1 Tax=Escallonia rubra TaxID=112253 RepID=A0AA88R7M6_9ASTE|nr:hypothetical protein RJ640_003085 [Escallonia rubra]
MVKGDLSKFAAVFHGAQDKAFSTFEEVLLVRAGTGKPLYALIQKIGWDDSTKKHGKIECIMPLWFQSILELHVQVSEASVSRNRSTIIVPAGSARDEGWAAFRNILAEINEASRLFVLPNQQQNSEPSERLVGLSDDVGAGFISGHSTQTAPTSDLNVDRSIDLPPSDETGNLGVSKVIRADQKRFFFDLGSNNRGHFLRISEVAGSDRSSIILPLSGLRQFYEMVGHFVDITKDRIEGMTGANVRTVEPPQR